MVLDFAVPPADAAVSFLSTKVVQSLHTLTMGDAGLPHSLQESLDNTKVSYVQLGKSGLRVSVPILGAMSFGG